MVGFSAWLRCCTHSDWIRNEHPLGAWSAVSLSQASLSPPAGREDRGDDSKFPLSVSLLREPFGFYHMTSPNRRPQICSAPELTTAFKKSLKPTQPSSPWSFTGWLASPQIFLEYQRLSIKERNPCRKLHFHLILVIKNITKKHCQIHVSRKVAMLEAKAW